MRNHVLFQVETTNPEVTVWIVNLSKPKYLFPQQIKPTGSVESGSYVTSASFFGDNNVAVVWMNRKQNTSVIVTCKSQNGFNCTDVSIVINHNEDETCPVETPNRILFSQFSHSGHFQFLITTANLPYLFGIILFRTRYIGLLSYNLSRHSS